MSPGFGTGTGRSKARRNQPEQPTLLPEPHRSAPAEDPWPQFYGTGQYADTQPANEQSTNEQYGDPQYGDTRSHDGQYGYSQYEGGGYDQTRVNTGQYTSNSQYSSRSQYTAADQSTAGDQYQPDQYSNSQHPNSQHPNSQHPNSQYPSDAYQSDPFQGGPFQADQHLGGRDLSRRRLRPPAPRRRTGLRIAQVLGVGGLAAALIIAVLGFLFPGTLPGTTSTSASAPIDSKQSASTGDRAPKVAAPSTEPEPEKEALPSEIPDLGPKTLAKIPARTRQVIVAEGRGKNSSYSKVILYHRTSEGWRAGETWSARNGRKGWSAKHREDDLRSPIGVFALTDTGGLLPDVGGKLPYYQSDLFTIDRLGMLGQSLAGSYDYVIAINYNRRPGRSPLDRVRPLGQTKGGGIWLHVRSDGPTQACISLTRAQMRTLVKTLDPAKKPVIVMGDRTSLSK